MINGNSSNFYVGNGSATVYPYTFKIFSASHLKVVTRGPNEGDPEITLQLGVDYSVSGVNSKTGGNVTMLLGAPALNTSIAILRSIPVIQDADIRNQGDYYPEYIENALDKSVMMVQMVRDRLTKTLNFGETLNPDFNTQIPEPVPGGVIGFNEDGDGMVAMAPGEFVGPEGPQGNPLLLSTGVDPNVDPPVGVTPNPGDLCVNSEGLFFQYNGTTWEDTGVQLQISNASVNGFSLRYGEEVSLNTTQEIADYIFQIGYLGPAVSLSSAGSGTIREKGTNTTAGNLIAAVTKRTNDIASVIFFKNNVQIHSVAVPNPAGGNESYADGVQFNDTTTYRVDVRDVVAGGNGNTLAQSSVTYNFVYPYYAVGGAAGLNGAAIRAAADDANKKKVIASTANIPNTFTTGSPGVLYFAQPAGYPSLTSILDSNNFETLSSWPSSLKDIVGLDGTTQSYRVYEFANVLPAGSYTFTFKR